MEERVREKRKQKCGGAVSTFLRVSVRDAVWSENTLLFHRDKKFNVWIITSELIDPACPRRISTELLTYFAYPLPTTTAEMLRFSEGTRLTERSFTYDID